ncbi:MAG TPA: ribbon-helix-helix domain-containing protein [Candidatus Nanoarchaeia archaeon]|nr:ribbon-helix-helix domain-containing protein [Candidatus Nanoarchaeia archaeon]
MVMDTIQIRLSHGLVERIDDLVETGIYTNRSDAVRDAVRRLILSNLVGIIPNTGDSVKEIREIRRKLSKEIKSFKDVEEINKLID